MGDRLAQDAGTMMFGQARRAASNQLLVNRLRRQANLEASLDRMDTAQLLTEAADALESPEA